MLGLGLGLDKSVSKINYHISTWDTTKTSSGSSNNDQIKLPTYNGGSYNCVIYWGDGTNSTITTWDDADLTHTYAVAGIYTIYIIGQFEGFIFNNAGDRLKLSSIENGGNDFRLGAGGGYFYGCANLTSIDNINTAGIQNFTAAFRGCSKLNCALNLNTESATTMYTMLYQCTLFNNPVKQLSIALCTNLNLMLTGTAISNTYYSDALIQWSSLSHQNTVTLACTAKYEARAVAARTDFINNHAWTINDGGAA
jgi:hypothetical protein